MILFETLSQPYILVWLIFSGFCSGFLFDITNTITFLCNNNKVVKNIFQALATISSFLILFFVNLNTNYGQFRIYVLVVFLLFLFLQRLTLGKLIAKTNVWCYTNFRKLTNLLTKVKLNGKQKKQKKV